MSALDATNYYNCQKKYGNYFGGGDMTSLIVLDSGAESPSFDDIRGALAARIALIPALREKVLRSPGDLAYPHWGTDPTAPETKFTEMPGDSWGAVLDTVRSIPLDGLEPLVSAWRGYVWRNVSGAPGVADRATIIATKVSHTLTDGRGVSQIQRALFGDDAALAVIPGHGNPSAKVRLSHVLSELARAPWNLRNFQRVARSASPSLLDSSDFVAVEELNGRGSRFAFLDVRHVGITDLRWAGTVTETGLTASSIALEAYLAKLGVSARSLSAQLPVVPKGIDTLSLPVPSGNTAGIGVVVDLAVGTLDPNERATIIRRNLADTIAEQTISHLAIRELFERLPVQALQANAARSALITQVPWHIGLTSYSKGPADLTLLGDPVAFMVGVPMLRPGLGVAQKLIGLGDQVTVAIAASDAIPQPELYADLLHAAIRREI
ncbi:WS/DGAT domain-containing protein [Smaragdicoccus niigatensis]|uniref:WS/DGAT domain-containing protein n=1 Tax=Smaragdicoccus niigatensis TaxID=359359 RepID=UPI001FE1B340|nr:WS/DGAT domain-containing protein [Smaragdicoccus niigatensis]